MARKRKEAPTISVCLRGGVGFSGRQAITGKYQSFDFLNSTFYECVNYAKYTDLDNIFSLNFRKRLFRYLIPVTLFSVLFNIPKFMESKVVYIEKVRSSIFKSHQGILLHTSLCVGLSAVHF